MLGVVKDVTPVPLVNIDPTVATEYQSMVSPAAAVADKVTVPVPHIDADVTVGATGKALTVMLAIIFEPIIEVQPVPLPDFIEAIVTVVLPTVANTLVVKAKVPAVVTVAFADNPLAKLGADKP